ncbi:MAG: hypothetical protein EXR77_07180 [Myxococcales bacterium]|nr:hypothetical protein [Myxococcales bacterium]
MDLVADLLADIVKRVTRQADRFFAKRANADAPAAPVDARAAPVDARAAPADARAAPADARAAPADPVIANLLHYSLFGPQELERVDRLDFARALKRQHCPRSQFARTVRGDDDEPANPNVRAPAPRGRLHRRRHWRALWFTICAFGLRRLCQRPLAKRHQSAGAGAQCRGQRSL